MTLSVRTTLGLTFALLWSKSATDAPEAYDWSDFYIGVIGSGTIGNNKTSANYGAEPIEDADSDYR
ncbi:hypothetical protein SAMN02983003_2561 [Devosia enhydra]|uniref:Uncharacterized protein n=1 Tax=Devosia enhydra TaxID=665118 RepID=A0A1K2HZ31_9HYPH|nr:hypothetical protein SAMN02983003_2561 [Devosia enhydra]